MERIEENIINDFCESWRTLNPNLLIKHLSKDFVYNSQWVFDSLDYKGYVDYLNSKFLTIKEQGAGPMVEIVDDIDGEFPKMLKLDQNGNLAYYRIKVKNNQVIKGDLCMF